MKPFSIQTLTALAEVVTGGSASDPSPPIGHYRSGPKLERFFGGLNVELRIGNASRLPSVQLVLENVARGPNGAENIVRVIEALVDPRDFLGNPEKLTAVVDYMNKRLEFDGYQLRKLGHAYKVVAVATNTVAAMALKDKAKALDLGSVHADFERALSEAESDPADAITSACSTVESVCKCILDEMAKPYPANKDIKGLLTEVAKHLNLSPGRDDLPKEWEQDIRQILSGLFSVVGGIGAPADSCRRRTRQGQKQCARRLQDRAAGNSRGQHCVAVLHRNVAKAHRVTIAVTLVAKLHLPESIRHCKRSRRRCAENHLYDCDSTIARTARRRACGRVLHLAITCRKPGSILRWVTTASYSASRVSEIVGFPEEFDAYSTPRGGTCLSGQFSQELASARTASSSIDEAFCVCGSNPSLTAACCVLFCAHSSLGLIALPPPAA